MQGNAQGTQVKQGSETDGAPPSMKDIRKQQLIKINTGLKEIGEISAKLDKVTEDYVNSDTLKLFKKHRADISDAISKAGADLKKHSTALLQGGASKDEITSCFKNLDAALKVCRADLEEYDFTDVLDSVHATKGKGLDAKLVAANQSLMGLDALIKGMESKPQVPGKFYDTMVDNYNFADELYKLVLKDKEAGEWGTAVEHLNTYKSDGKTFTQVKAFVANVDALVKEAKELQTELFELMGVADSIVKTCAGLMHLRNSTKQPFPRELYDALREREDKVAETIKAADELMSKGEFKSAVLTLKSWDGKNIPLLKDIQRQVEAIEAELKELAELDKETAPPPPPED